MRSPRLSDRILAAGAAFLPALILSWPLLAAHGIPAFNHDWSWPPDAAAAWGAFQNSAHAFSDDNFGALNYYLGSAPSTFIVYLFVAAFGSAAAVKLLVFLLLAGASAGAYALARALGAPASSAAACALVYGASPVSANELAAGHIAYLFAYAGLPCVAWCAVRLAARPRVILFAVLIPVCTVAIAQPQFAFFNAIAVLVFLPLASSRAAVLALLGAAALAFAASPFEIAAALAGHPLSGLYADLTTLHWEAANSAPLLQSFAGAGYAPRYDQAAPAALLWLRTGAAAALWLFAAAAVWQRPRRLAFFVAALVAALVVAGTNGPLALALNALFTHVPQASLFRELYHFSALAVLGVAVLASTSRFARVSGAAAILAVLFILPQLTGGFWRFVGSYDGGEMQALSRIVERDPGNGRVLYWPLLQPMGPHGDRAGADPDAFPIGSHPAVSEFIPVQPLSQIGFLLCDPHTDVRTFLAEFGIRYVVIRTHWRSMYFTKIEPALQPLGRRAPAGDCGTDRLLRVLPIAFRGSTHALAIVPDPKPLVSTSFSSPLYRLPVRSAFDADRASVDPRRNWVDATRWQWWNRSFLGPVNPGLITLGRAAYRLPAAARGRSLLINAGRVFRSVKISPHTRTLRAAGPTLLAGVAVRPQPSPRGRACASIVPEGAAYRISSAGCPQVTVEMSSLPMSGWTLRDRRGRTIAALASAWDEQWRVPASEAPLTLSRNLPAAVQAGLAAQYAEWTAFGAALAALLCMTILRIFAFATPTKDQD